MEEKKPIYKKWWFWLIIIVVLIAIAGGTQTGNNSSVTTNTNTSTSNEVINPVNKTTNKQKEQANTTDYVSVEYKNALKKAQSYSEIMHMSKQGIYKQLTSSAEGFAADAAQYAIDNLQADYKANALAKAKDYQQTMSMSKQAVYKQLTSSVEGFSEDEAQYAIDNLAD